jgi:hypothetical protein
LVSFGLWLSTIVAIEMHVHRDNQKHWDADLHIHTDTQTHTHTHVYTVAKVFTYCFMDVQSVFQRWIG